jgi:hypothetical protein
MTNIHTPQRLKNESFEAYKARRVASKEQVRKLMRPQTFRTPTGFDITGRPNRWALTLAIPNYKASKIKNTKHTRAGSKKRKGAL